MSANIALNIYTHDSYDVYGTCTMPKIDELDLHDGGLAVLSLLSTNGIRMMGNGSDSINILQGHGCLASTAGY